MGFRDFIRRLTHQKQEPARKSDKDRDADEEEAEIEELVALDII